MPPGRKPKRKMATAPGSSGMFVQSEKFVLEHGGRLGDISIYGQESNATTRKHALMDLALRGVEADFGPAAIKTNMEGLGYGL